MIAFPSDYVENNIRKYSPHINECKRLTGKCPASPALRTGSLPSAGRKGHNIYDAILPGSSALCLPALGRGGELHILSLSYT